MAVSDPSADHAPVFSDGTGYGALNFGVPDTELGESILVQPDGALDIVSAARFRVTRLDPGGGLDASFNGSGTQTTQIAGDYSYSAAQGILQSDGKIVVVGFSPSPSGSALLRLNGDGTPDETFNGTGNTTQPGYMAVSAAMDADGKFVVLGSSADGFAVWRVNSDGTSDTGFNGTGLLDIPLAGAASPAKVAVQSDGKILVAGSVQQDSTFFDYSLFRLNADGTLDTTFGDAGEIHVPLPGEQHVYDMLVQPDGKIFLAGAGFGEWGLVRLNEDGSLDTAFNGTGGTAVTNHVTYACALQPDGKILLTGVGVVDAHGAISVARLNGDGSLDTTFNGTGQVLIDAPSESNGVSLDGGWGIAVQPDGRIIVTGHGEDELFVARLESNGAFDYSFLSPAHDEGDAPIFTEGGDAVALPAPPAVHDTELDALNNWGGAGITVHRADGTSADDVFSATGNLSFAAGHAQLDSTVVGTVTNTGGELTITFADGTTKAQVDSVLSQLAYANTSDAPPSQVTIEYLLNDGNSGSQGTGGAMTASSTAVVDLTAVNDAPAVDTSAAFEIPSVQEGAANPDGITVADLIPDGSITDPDGDTVEAIAITALDASLGSWQYSVDGGTTWLTIDAKAIDSATNELALLLGADSKIRLLPFGTLNGSLENAITFRAWDQTEGTQGEYRLIDTTGGTTAFSSDAVTATVTVEDVNHAPAFGKVDPGGVVNSTVGSSIGDAGQALVLQPDGGIVVAAYDFQVARFGADGAPDAAFGDNGVAKAIGGAATTQLAFDAALQADGKILVAGSAGDSSLGDFMLSRLNADGSLDATFGGGTVDVGSFAGQAHAVAVQTDGKILVAGMGTRSAEPSWDVLVTRLDADGAIDTTFGDSGVAQTDMTGHSTDVPNDVLVQSDGKIVVVGGSTPSPYPSPADFMIVRYNTDGTLDTSFDGDGKVSTDFGGWDIANAAVLQQDGKIVVAGYTDKGGYEFAIARYNADGSLDASFGGTGQVTTALGGAEAQSIALQDDGKIVVAGTSAASDGLVVVRYDTDGTLDATFGDAGIATVSVEGTSPSARQVAIQQDGRIVVTGIASDGEGGSTVVVARLDSDGSVDGSFNSHPDGGVPSGSVDYTEGGAAVALTTASAIHDADLDALAAGAGDYAGAQLTVARAGGASADDVFSALGNLAIEGGTATLSGLDIGTVSNANGALVITFNHDATQARVNEVLSSIGYSNASDAPDSSAGIEFTFDDGNTGAQGAGGAMSASATVTVDIASVNDAPLLAPAGPIALPATEQGDVNPQGISIADLIPDGAIVDPDGDAVKAIAITTLDASLGAWQYTIDGGSSWLAIDADAIDSTTNELALLLGPDAKLRLLPFGSLNGTLDQAITFRAWDQTSGTSGQYVSIAATGGESAFSTDSAFAAATVTAVDTGPAADNRKGWVITDVQSGLRDIAHEVIVQADGSIVVTGVSGTADDTEAFSLARYLADGQLDPSFGSGGTVTGPFDQGAFLEWRADQEAGGQILLVGPSLSTAVMNVVDTSGVVGSSPSPTLPGGVTFPRDVAVQTDGRFVVASLALAAAPGGNVDFALTRFESDGTLDTAFGDGGTVTTDFDGGNDVVRSLEVESDGSILVLGRHDLGGTASILELARYDSQGNLDTSFGTGGKLVTTLHAGGEPSDGLAIQADGKIVVAGTFYGPLSDADAPDSTDAHFAVMRFNADGSVDTGFGTGGTVITGMTQGSQDFMTQTVVQPDGKILLAGSTLLDGNWDIALVRYDANGDLDTTFNGTGKLQIDLGSDDEAADVRVQPDGKIVIAGTTNAGGGADFVLARLNADGSFDTSFGTLQQAAPEIDPSVAFSLGTVHESDAAPGGVSVSAIVGEGGISDVNGDTLGIAVTALDTSLGGWEYSTDGGQSWQTIDTNTIDSAADEVALLLGPDALLRMLPSGDLNGTLAQAITFRAWDGTTGTQGDYAALTATGGKTAFSADSATAALTVSAVNDAPVFGASPADVGGTVIYLQLGGKNAALDTNVSVHDVELGALAQGFGDYKGATFTVARSGAANAADTFSLGGAATIDSGDVLVAGVVVGTATISNGTLAVTFNDDATEARVDSVLSSVQYSNDISAPGQITVKYSFNDGNTGAQGSGGALGVTGTVTVKIAPPTAVFATGTAGPDLLIGDKGSDFLSGLDGNDTLLGFGGNDTLTGGLGIDSMDGGDGNDTYVIATSNEHQAAEIFDSGGSADEVRFEAGSGATLTLFAGDTGIDKVTLAAGTAALSVNAAAVKNGLWMTGNSGTNSLTGTAFDDTIDGGAGADKMSGGAGNDTYVVDNPLDSVTDTAGLDTVRSSVNYVLGKTIENLVLVNGAVQGTGNALANVITGDAGNNVIDGKAGIDTLDGGAGSDIYIVGLATDHSAAEIADSGGGIGTDEVRFTAKSGILTLFAGDTGIERVVVGTGTDATAITTGTGAAGINASAVLNGLVMVGNSGANALTGTAFADTIDGGLGNDVLTGGAGNDTFLFTTMTTGTRNRDTITDFQAGQDRLQFSKAAYTGIAGGPGTLSAVQFWSGAGVVAAHDADDRFIYNTTTGVLYYDPDGTGTLAASQVAILGTTVHPALNYTDIQVIS